jgi:hypothetical protein
MSWLDFGAAPRPFVDRQSVLRPKGGKDGRTVRVPYRTVLVQYRYCTSLRAFIRREKSDVRA